MADIIGAHRIAVKIYRLDGTNWVEFSPQPIVPGLTDGIWGGPNGTIWTHNNQTGPNQRYLFFNGVSWSQYVGVSSNYRPNTIHGSDDGLHVYSACEFELHKWNGVSWSLLKDLYPLRTIWRARNIWCDASGQHVWTTPGHAIGGVFHVYYSDDYGATWTDMYPGALADLGLSAAYAPTANGIWGLSPTAIYINWGWGSGAVPPALNGNAGGISLYNGSSWSWVAQSAGNDYLMQQDGSVWADGAGVYVCNGGWANESVHVASGGALVLKVTAANHDPPYGRNVIGIEGVVAVVALDGKLISDPPDQYVSFDNGATWQQTTYPWSGNRGLGSLTVYGWVGQIAPRIQNQNPAPSSSGNRADGATYCEVVDDNGDLVASSVRIWVDGVPAWQGSAAASGWTGTRTGVTDGYGYSFTPENPIASGSTITIRVYAVDELGNVLDTTYTFDTGIFLDALTGRVSERGGDLILAEGLFPRGEALEVTLDGEPCYGGQGKGYSPSSDDGTTLEVAAPPIATLGASKTFEIVSLAGTLQGQIAVVERAWHKAEFESRVSHPPWLALGPRRLDLEPPVGD